MSENNTHVAMAKFRQEGVHEWQAEEGSTDATNLAAALDAQTEATLALAYEQRTANLIALWSKPQVTMQDINGNPMTHSINTDKVGQLLHEILERLGAA
ncbi:hypothetical protein SEA_EVEPICKLES_91 [Arthrobacter phage EvePickles]|nr:hypothetical protein SEA_EVEPICKLES_91 [Arthrobacter phage EvePickles]